jgi:hypothetical protein
MPRWCPDSFAIPSGFGSFLFRSIRADSLSNFLTPNMTGADMELKIVMATFGIAVLAISGCENKELESQLQESQAQLAATREENSRMENELKNATDELRYLSDAILISGTEWHDEKKRLKVTVRIAEPGQEVVVSDASNPERVLASGTIGDKEEEFQMQDVTNPPCRVRVQRSADGVAVERDVDPKPDTCG